MFRLTKPETKKIENSIEAASLANVMHAEHLRAVGSDKEPQLRKGFAHDILRTQIGTGEEAFGIAIQAIKAWSQFDLGWVRVANPQARIEAGQIVAVEVQSLGLWSLNLNQIIEVWRSETSFGFLYKTTPFHVEEGEERFVVTYDPPSNELWYETEAVSRPLNLFARIGYPVTRAFQHRFAKDSHRRMREAVLGWRCEYSRR